MADTVETAIYRLRVEGQAEVDRLAKSVEGLAVAEEHATAATRTTSQTLQNRLARMDPLIRAQEQYRKELESAARHAESGVGTSQQIASQIQLATQRYNTQVKAIQDVEKATGQMATKTGLARHELINLGRQGADVFTQLASGQSLFLIAAQQGPQVLDILATSQIKVGDAFKSALGWAGRFLTSTAGIVTGIGAIAVGAVYMASQFSRASTTIEEALETQNRLLKEGKALLDARTSAEARAGLQSKEQTQFETLQNQIDLQIKLNKAMEEAADIARRRSTRPTEVPGEMGVAPTAFAATSDPGMDKITAAFVALKEAQDAGLPGLKQFNAELAKVGMAHPELALVVQDMLKTGEAGLKLEFAAQRAKAMSDALKGIATDAQLAAVGLGSIAQFAVNDQQAKEAAAATERQAVATMQLAQVYPGISIETAKQLAQHSLQLPVVQAITGAQQMAAQYAADYANALAAGKSEADAVAIAVMNIEKAQAAATASVLKQVEALKDQNAMIKAQQSGTEKTVAASIAYKNAIASGADETSAAALKAETLKNYMLQAQSAASGFAGNIRVAADAIDEAAMSASAAGQIIGGNSGSYTPGEVYRPTTMTQSGSFSFSYGGSAIYGQGGAARRMSEPYNPMNPPDFFRDWNAVSASLGGGYNPSGAGIEWSNGWDTPLKLLTSSVENLTTSTDNLRLSNQELLSPFYNQDPRTSHIGFRSQGMASGGEFTVPGGYSANDNMIGTIPLASGEIVSVRRPGQSAGGTTIHVENHIHVSGGVDKKTINAIGRTTYQQTQNAARNLQAASR